MARSKIFACGTSTALSADNYFHLSGRILIITTQSKSQVTWNKGGTLSDYTVNVTVNTTTACDFYVQQNGSNTTMVVSYTSGQTGIKQDVTHSITVSAGDELNQFADITSGSAITLAATVTTFNASSNTYQMLTNTEAEAGRGQNDALTVYYNPSTSGAAGASTESDATIEMMLAGNFKHLFVNVITNTHTTATSDFYLSVNASTVGCPTVQYTATQTGFKEDTSTTKSVVDADDVCFKCITAANAGTTTITYTTISIGFETTTNQYQQTGGGIIGTIADALTRFFAVHGVLSASTTEANRELTSQSGTSNITELVTEVSANTNTANPSVDFWLSKNQATTALTTSYTASQTGTKSSTGSVVIIDGDEICYKVITGTSAANLVTVQQVSTLLTSIITRSYGVIIG